MNPKKNIPKNIAPDPGNPFKVPEGYFDDVRKRVMERIRAEEQSATGQYGHRVHETEAKSPFVAEAPLDAEAKAALNGAAKAPFPGTADAPLVGGKEPGGNPDGKAVSRRKKIYLQPYLTLAAAISGVALVVYIVLQAVTGSRSDEAYDIAMLDRAGVIQDESILAETFTGEDEASTYSEWDEEAIVYLASNEVDLLDLIDTN